MKTKKGKELIMRVMQCDKNGYLLEAKEKKKKNNNTKKTNKTKN